MIESYLLMVIVFLLAFFCWREWHFSRLIDQLTNKVMSKSFAEYSAMTLDTNVFDNKTENEPKNEQVQPNDPILGKTY